MESLHTCTHMYVYDVTLYFVCVYYFMLPEFFAEFRSGKAPILIATDVASRGLGKQFVFGNIYFFKHALIFS